MSDMTDLDRLAELGRAVEATKTYEAHTGEEYGPCFQCLWNEDCRWQEAGRTACDKAETWSALKSKVRAADAALDERMKSERELSADLTRIVNWAVNLLATHGFDAEWHDGYWTLHQDPQATLIPDGAEDRLRKWLTAGGEG